MQKMPAAGSADPRRLAALVAASALLLQACSNFGPSCSTSDDSNPSDSFTEGTVESGVYMSSPWSGPLLWFPGGKRYDLHHKLGCRPRNISVWVAFSEDGVAAGSMAPAAGNMTVMQQVDDQIIRIKNDTCSDYYLMVTASAPDCAAPDRGSSDGGTDAPAD